MRWLFLLYVHFHTSSNFEAAWQLKINQLWANLACPNQWTALSSFSKKIRFQNNPRILTNPLRILYQCVIRNIGAINYFFGDQTTYVEPSLIKTNNVGATLIRKQLSILSYSKRKISPTENWTPVSRVTGGDTDHYTIEDLMLAVPS